jgi:hypothetical protein
MYHHSNNERYSPYMFSEVRSPKHARCDAFCNAIFLFAFGWQHCTARLRIECATCLTSGLAIIMPILLRTAGSRCKRTQTQNSTILQLRSKFTEGTKLIKVKIKIIYERLGVLTVLKIQVMVFCIAMLCSDVVGYHEMALYPHLYTL